MLLMEPHSGGLEPLFWFGERHSALQCPGCGLSIHFGVWQRWALEALLLKPLLLGIFFFFKILFGFYENPVGSGGRIPSLRSSSICRF